MRPIKRLILLPAIGIVLAAAQVWAQGNLDIDTPIVGQLKASMGQRYSQLQPYYQSGAVGLTRDGAVNLRDPASIPLAQRQTVTALVAAENADRAGLYKEIARANGNPGWEADIRATFAQRWIERAPAGWWIQNTTGGWQKKP